MPLPGPPLYGASHSLLTGKIVGGRYEILGSLAHGGMAEVFLAKQIGIDGFEKLVAVKTIAGRNADDEYFVAMFLDEARTAGDLRHPNVVQTFEVGVDEDLYFIAMEFLQGASLARMLRRSMRVPNDIAVQIVREAAAGLHHAHTKTDLSGRPLGIVHRDVSPQNIIVTVDGAAKIVDFGIALANQRSVQTSTGGLKGKFPYMSPEQAEGDGPVDARSDLFALGVMLWEMVTGRPLFRRDNEVKTLDAVRACRVPRPSSVAAGIPAVLDDAIVAMLQKDPADRPRDGAAVVALLESVEQALGFVPRASKLAAFLEQSTDDTAIANAPTAVPSRGSGAPPSSSRGTVASPGRKAPLPHEPVPLEPAATTLTAAAQKRQRASRRYALAALAIGAVVTAVAFALPSGSSSSTSDAGVAVDAGSARAAAATSTTAAVEARVDAGVPAASVADAGDVDAGARLASGAAAHAGGEAREVDAGSVAASGSAAHAAKAKTRAGAKGKHEKEPPPPPPPAPTAFGALTFPDTNPWFNVRLDGADIGPTPMLKPRKVAAGPHRVQLVAPESGAVVVDRDVVVAEGVTKAVRR